MTNNNERQPLLPAHATTMPRKSRPSSTSKLQLAALVLLASLIWLARAWNGADGGGGDNNNNDSDGPRDNTIPLEVHIMSKCPDARDCMQKLVLPTMAQVARDVNFTLSFIGTVNNHDDGVQCKHGPTECLGNILMLCAAAEYPDPKAYLGFANCLIADYTAIPSQSLAEDCALEHGLDFGVLNDCMSRDSGGYGMGLLRASVLRSQQVGVRTSCTVRLEERVRCVRDEGRWKECGQGERPEDLVRDIERLHHGAPSREA